MWIPASRRFSMPSSPPRIRPNITRSVILNFVREMIQILRNTSLALDGRIRPIAPVACPRVSRSCTGVATSNTDPYDA